MREEAIVEPRGEAPVSRTQSPLWKWVFVATLILVGAGIMAAILLGSSEPPEALVEEEGNPQLRFNVAAYELPELPQPPPEPPVPEPEPKPVTAPAVIEVPPPEPRYPLPPPVPAAPKPAEPPENLDEKRRLTAPLTKSAGGAPNAPVGEGTDVGRDTRSGIDLSVTRATTAVARRMEELTFVLPKGTYINCILDTAIQSDQAGLVSCTLPEDVYGADGTVVLLDRGSQVLGEYRTATLTYGKRRLFVVWSRMRTPGGVVVDIDSPGTGPLGRAGTGGSIDNHYWERVGIPVLMSTVSFGVESYARDVLTSDQSRYLQQTTNNTLSGVLGELAKIKPTLHKNQGDSVSIIVARDLDLSPVYALRTGYGHR